MRIQLSKFFTVIVVLGILATACAPTAETATATPVATATQATQSTAEAPQESGPKTVTGKLTYTNLFFTEGVAQPVIILEDQGGFVKRDRKFLIPIESQIIGEITSDFYTSPVSYSLSLPAEPNGTLHDVDHDGNEETGVMIFAVAYWTNTWGDPFLERRDQGGGGWSTAYASTKVSADRNSYFEVYGGKYLVYCAGCRSTVPL